MEGAVPLAQGRLFRLCLAFAFGRISEKQSATILAPTNQCRALSARAVSALAHLPKAKVYRQAAMGSDFHRADLDARAT